MTAARTRLLWRLGTLAAILALLAYVVVYAWPVLAGNAVGSVAEDRAEACLPGRAVSLMPSPHVSSAEAAQVEYNSLPPTSGPHYSFAPALGVYENPVADGLTVHALEHGHIVILYSLSLPADDVDSLHELSREYPRDVLLAPYPDLPHGIALTAWGRLDTMSSFEEDRVWEFVEQLRGRYDHGWTGPLRCSDGR